MAKDRSIQIFACGGAGLNIASKINRGEGDTESAPGTVLNVAYIDTSPANEGSIGPDDFFYRIPGLDGSGQKRDEYPAEIMAHIPTIIQQAKTGDLNIIIFSGAGGSGSVVGPLLVNELLRRGELAIAIMVGAQSTYNWLKNTIGTFRTLVKYSNVRKKALPLVYYENGTDGDDDDVDNMIIGMVAGISMLLSGKNKELDTEDFYNFINYNRVTSFEPGVVTLYVEDKTSGHSSNGGQIVSVASLAKDRSSAVYDNGVLEYQTIGLIDDEAASALDGLVPMHFVLADGLMQEIVARLEAKKVELDSNKATRVASRSILRESDITDDDTPVF